MVWIDWPSIKLSGERGSFIVFSPCSSICWGEFVMLASGWGGIFFMHVGGPL